MEVIDEHSCWSQALKRGNNHKGKKGTPFTGWDGFYVLPSLTFLHCRGDQLALAAMICVVFSLF